LWEYGTSYIWGNQAVPHVDLWQKLLDLSSSRPSRSLQSWAGKFSVKSSVTVPLSARVSPLLKNSFVTILRQLIVHLHSDIARCLTNPCARYLTKRLHAAVGQFSIVKNLQLFYHRCLTQCYTTHDKMVACLCIQGVCEDNRTLLLSWKTEIIVRNNKCFTKVWVTMTTVWPRAPFYKRTWHSSLKEGKIKEKTESVFEKIAGEVSRSQNTHTKNQQSRLET